MFSLLIIPIRLILKDIWSKDENVKQTKWLEDLTKGKRERIIWKIVGKGINRLRMIILNEPKGLVLKNCLK